jgi:hypothetical protein
VLFYKNYQEIQRKDLLQKNEFNELISKLSFSDIHNRKLKLYEDKKSKLYSEMIILFTDNIDIRNYDKLPEKLSVKDIVEDCRDIIYPILVKKNAEFSINVHTKYCLELKEASIIKLILVNYLYKITNQLPLQNSKVNLKITKRNNNITFKIEDNGFQLKEINADNNDLDILNLPTII